MQHRLKDRHLYEAKNSKTGQLYPLVGAIILFYFNYFHRYDIHPDIPQLYFYQRSDDLKSVFPFPGAVRA